MKKLRQLLTSMSFYVRLNVFMIVVWLILLFPTFMFWKQSIWWVVVMSWYANFIGHLSSWAGSRAATEADTFSDDQIEKLKEILREELGK